MKTASPRELRARAAIRDRLLDGILGHLRKRDPDFARIAERAVILVRANDSRILEARAGRDVKAFARMALSRGKLKPIPAGPGSIRDAKMKTWLVEAYIRTAQEERDPDEPAADLIQEVWQQCLAGTEKLTNLPADAAGEQGCALRWDLCR
jgi:hypothetical protein